MSSSLSNFRSLEEKSSHFPLGEEKKGPKKGKGGRKKRKRKRGRKKGAKKGKREWWKKKGGKGKLEASEVTSSSMSKSQLTNGR